VRFAARAIYVRFFLYRKERLSLLAAALLPIASVTSGAVGESLTRLSYLFSFYFLHPFFWLRLRDRYITTHDDQDKSSLFHIDWPQAERLRESQ
jgi:hypothetical protein